MKSPRLTVSVVLLNVLTTALLASVSAFAADHTVVIEGVVFVPETLTVRAGDTVTWINKDPFPHTATAQDRSFDSRDIPANKRWKYTARKAGSFPYVCTLHPTMKGTLIVSR
ncbi:MAG: cupredoxin domain-containing protein [Burkholderiales bacterium]